MYSGTINLPVTRNRANEPASFRRFMTYVFTGSRELQELQEQYERLRAMILAEDAEAKQ